MTEYLCRLCGAHYQGSHTCNGAGNWEWTDPNKIYDLQARIAQLTAERDEWKQDAERFIQLANFNNKRAGEYFELHEQLVKKYEVTK